LACLRPELLAACWDCWACCLTCCLLLITGYSPSAGCWCWLLVLVTDAAAELLSQLLELCCCRLQLNCCGFVCVYRL
jgi:hypothetical protein